MMELITIDEVKGIVLHPQAFKLTTHLCKVKIDQLKYIHLAYDYNSVFKQFPPADKKRKAKIKVYGEKSKYDPEKDDKLVKAIEEYKALQYDPEMQILETYSEKLSNLNYSFSQEKDEKKMLIIMQTIEKINVAAKQLQQQINADKATLILKGGGELTFIEQWQLNQLKYKKEKKLEKERTGIEFIE